MRGVRVKGGGVRERKHEGKMRKEKNGVEGKLWRVK